MYFLDDCLVTSASDLSVASGCEFAFLRALDRRLGWIDDPKPEDDAMLKRASELGDVHEQQWLAQLRQEHGDGVVEIPRPDGFDVASLRAGAEATRDALLAGAPVVFQGVFFDETDPELPFVGYADFIIRQPDDSYRIVDTKLARRVKVTALLQLAAYHEQLERMGLHIDPTVELVLGDGRSATALIDNIAPVFRIRRSRLHHLIREHRAEGRPVVWGDDRYVADGDCAECKGPAAAADDLVGVAKMSMSNRSKLRAVGITTMAELAATSTLPADCRIAASTFQRLQQQAALQVRSAEGLPELEVVDPSPIQRLPEPNAGDMFFDFEGDPMYAEPGPANSTLWGLDYLFGWVDAESKFEALWAHSLDEERAALEAFIAHVTRQRARFPGMHIYHYAPYEKTHLTSIAARHGVCEAEVDTLLRDGVLVDLYPVVRAALRVGVASYSIKKLEPLYMGDSVRQGVTNAGDSVDEYARSRELDAAGDALTAQAILDEIADYNEYDCVSTLRLRDWLLTLVPRAAPTSVAADDDVATPLAFEPSSTDRSLLLHAEAAEAAGNVTDAEAYRLAAAAVDFHRREAKSFWWEHFARLEQPADEWESTRGVFTVDESDWHVETDWHKEGRQRNERRHLYLGGQWAPGSGAPRPGGEVFGVAGSRAQPVKFLDPAGDDASVRIEQVQHPDGPFVPSHLTPAAPPKADNLQASIEEWAQAVLTFAPHWPVDAVTALLRRQPPDADGGLEPMRDADDGVRAVTASLTRMRHGHLAVQGPPGTGKTYLASHVIANLVREHGWSVGVVAQSHKVVENVLDAIVLDAGLDKRLVGKQASRDQGKGYYSDGPFSEIAGYCMPFLHEHAASGCVIGGTAWTFSNRRNVERHQLDLLVVEEAGQFSLANTIAVSGAAKRLLLLGDPQQLPQVTQGVHPAPVDGSALGHIIGEHAVLPAEHGYFLAESRRMDAAVTAPVSRLAYEGKLRSHPSTASRNLAGIAPGVHPVAVPHTGNATSSSEEAEHVVRIVDEHLGLSWSDSSTKPLRASDIIVVTPYNAQVELLRHRLDAAGHQDVQVGTVDKFQGREAVIAIVSMAASDATEVARGLEFLLSPNRLNVSISRAKWAAYLVFSPGLLQHLPHSQAELAMLSQFVQLVEEVREH